MDGAASERALAILNHVKKLEAQGYTFEGAEASVHLMILHSTKGYCMPFRLLDYSVQVYDSNIDSASRVMRDEATGSHPTGHGPMVRATVKVRTNLDDCGTRLECSIEDAFGTNDIIQVADGNGPVDALAQALHRALEPTHPYIRNVELVDYKVRILDPTSATAAATRVMIEFRDKESKSTWTTVSVDTNVISASLNALTDGFEYALIENAGSCLLCDDFYALQ